MFKLTEIHDSTVSAQSALFSHGWDVRLSYTCFYFSWEWPITYIYSTFV